MSYNDDEPPLVTILVWVAIIALMILSVIIAKNPSQVEKSGVYQENSFYDNCLVQPNISYYPKFKYSVLASVSGYNATVEQCDDTPFTMASGKRVYDGAIANNCLPFGTKVKIKNKWYTVEDRMNKRYDCRYFDIFFWDFDEAKQWGRRTIKIEVHG